jgi:hypothetical protein
MNLVRVLGCRNSLLSRGVLVTWHFLACATSAGPPGGEQQSRNSCWKPRFTAISSSSRDLSNTRTLPLSAPRIDRAREYFVEDLVQVTRAPQPCTRFL